MSKSRNSSYVENHPQLEPLYDKKLTCLYCNQIFTSKKARSGMTRVLKQDSDYCTYYEGENPIFYDVFVCPHCGFAFTQSFSPFTPRKKEWIETEYIQKLDAVPNLCGKRGIPEALQAMKLGALASYLLNEEQTVTGNLFLRIAWLYRFQKDGSNEKEYLEKALRFYLESYERGNTRKAVMDEHQLLYLIGDLYTRLDRYNKAMKIFSILLSDKNIPPKIRSRAAETWNEYKDKKAADKNNNLGR